MSIATILPASITMMNWGDCLRMAQRRPATELTRCPWAKGDDYIQYHDTEWGVSVHDDRLLFE